MQSGTESRPTCSFYEVWVGIICDERNRQLSEVQFEGAGDDVDVLVSAGRNICLFSIWSRKQSLKCYGARKHFLDAESGVHFTSRLKHCCYVSDKMDSHLCQRPVWHPQWARWSPISCTNPRTEDLRGSRGKIDKVNLNSCCNSSWITNRII